MENILNNVGQGFLAFGDDLLIYEGYSIECKNIFGQEPENKKLSHLIYPDDKDEIRILDSVFSKSLNTDDDRKRSLYLAMLPSEVKINNCYISIEYKIVENLKYQDTKSFMAILTDITEKRVLEQKMEEEKTILSMIVKAAVDYRNLLDCVDDYKEFNAHLLDEIIYSEKNIEETIAELFRIIHTFKGNFSQFDILHLVEELHNIESVLSNIKKNNSCKSKKELKDLFSQFDMLTCLEADMDIIKNYLGEDYFNRKDTFPVRKESVLAIEGKMQETLSEKEKQILLPDVQRLWYTSLKEMLNSYADYVENLVIRMGKQIYPISITGDDVFVDADYYHDFIKSLIHVFRNMVDHGIETMDERIMQVKNEKGVIDCVIENRADYIILSIADDGAGMNVKKLREKAIEKEIYSEEVVSNIKEKEQNLFFVCR